MPDWRPSGAGLCDLTRSTITDQQPRFPCVIRYINIFTVPLLGFRPIKSFLQPFKYCYLTGPRVFTLSTVLHRVLPAGSVSFTSHGFPFPSSQNILIRLISCPHLQTF